MNSIYINAFGVTCSLGSDMHTVRHALFNAVNPIGLKLSDRYSAGHPVHLGLVDDCLPVIDALPRNFRSRNNLLAIHVLQHIEQAAREAVARYGGHRVAVVVGTSTAGEIEAEAARRQHEVTGMWPEEFDFGVQEMGNVAAFIAHILGTTGPTHVISTACSSGAKSLASAARLLRCGMVDAVIAGGVDALNMLTVAGFSALESVSGQCTNPLSKNRTGISLGEGAALFLLTRESAAVRLCGWGETSDAHHMSAPDPTGRGADMAMALALDRAGVRSTQLDYINLHGTGTVQNDAMESLAVSRLVGVHVPVSSTKPMTGHALAAAGAIEAAFACMVLAENPKGMLPAHWWDGIYDPELPKLTVVAPGYELGRPARYVLSNSFAFGGSNAALLFGGAS